MMMAILGAGLGMDGDGDGGRQHPGNSPPAATFVHEVGLVVTPLMIASNTMSKYKHSRSWAYWGSNFLR